MAEPKKTKPPELKYYDVKVEATLPATLTYKILAESPEQAVELMKSRQPNAVKHRLIGKKEFKIMVYDSGSNMIRFIKNLMG